MEHGLPSLEVTTIFQQSNGYIWFGTSRGISRFDGNQFHNYFYSPGTEHHLSNNFITDILEDNEGNIWVATEDGLNILKPDGDKQVIRKEDGLPSSWILNLLIDSNNIIWISTGEGTVFYDSVNQQFNIVDLQTPDSIIDLVELPDKRIIAAIVGDLSLLDTVEKKGEFVFADQLKQVMVTDDIITALSVVSDEILTISTEKSGLLLLNLKDNSIRAITTADGLASNNVTAILVLNDHQVITGHYEDGLSLIDLDTSVI